MAKKKVRMNKSGIVPKMVLLKGQSKEMVLDIHCLNVLRSIVSSYVRFDQCENLPALP